MEEHLNIPYAPSLKRNEFHELDLYVPTNAKDSPPPPLIVFVHGGAWRAEDKADHALLARRLASLTDYAVAVPNYRLTTTATPDVHHPAHTEDLLTALTFLLSWPGLSPTTTGSVSAPQRPYDRGRIFLMGHSCSAHMIASIVLDSGVPSLVPHPLPEPGAPTLLDALRGVVFSEGIFDLDLLLESFPSYKDWFIAPAFGTGESYAQFSVNHFPLRGSRLAPPLGPVRWLIVHSRGDTYVDLAQATAMRDHLTRLYTEYGRENVVTTLWDEFTEQHDDILLSDKFAETVAEFIKGDNL